MAEINIEELKEIKKALDNFNTDITQIISDSKSASSNIQTEAENEVQQTTAECKEVQEHVAALAKESAALSAKIEKYNSEIFKHKNRQNELLSEIEQYESQIAGFEQKAQSLEAQLDDCEDDSEYDQILAEINSCYNEIAVLQNMVQKCNDEIKQIKNDIAILESACSEEKKKKDNVDAELESEQRKLRRISDKLERMKSIFSRIRDDLDHHLQLYTQFNRDTVFKTTTQNNAIQKCIDQLEIYLSTNF